ncbi:MAG TPA: exodeoxyribonuclease VII small subunit [Thermodesulfovibrionales bacterium]|nr:exodeoxyribonuclease VII small subunit [Thermodesulfovibrionales bacterium]
MSKSKQLTYFQALTELEQIIAEIEAEKTDIDVLAEKVKRAAYLITFCKGRLRSTGEEIRKILNDIEDKTGAGEAIEREIDL